MKRYVISGVLALALIGAGCDAIHDGPVTVPVPRTIKTCLTPADKLGHHYKVTTDDPYAQHNLLDCKGAG